MVGGEREATYEEPPIDPVYQAIRVDSSEDYDDIDTKKPTLTSDLQTKSQSNHYEMPVVRRKNIYSTLSDNPAPSPIASTYEVPVGKAKVQMGWGVARQW